MRRRDLPGGVSPPSKTGLKRQAQAVQALADRLIAAPGELIASLDLPEKLADAIAAARRITSHGARARQRQFVAKLMRGLDLDAIGAALDADAERARIEAVRARRAERWRDRLVAEGDAALAEFITEHPSADRARLARLVDDALAARDGAGAPRARRELFRCIRELLAA